MVEWEEEGEEEEEGEKLAVHLESKKVQGNQSKVFCPLPLTSFDASELTFHSCDISEMILQTDRIPRCATFARFDSAFSLAKCFRIRSLSSRCVRRFERAAEAEHRRFSCLVQVSSCPAIVDESYHLDRNPAESPRKQFSSDKSSLSVLITRSS